MQTREKERYYSACANYQLTTAVFPHSSPTSISFSSLPSHCFSSIPLTHLLITTHGHSQEQKERWPRSGHHQGPFQGSQQTKRWRRATRTFLFSLPFAFYEIETTFNPPTMSVKVGSTKGSERLPIDHTLLGFFYQYSIRQRWMMVPAGLVFSPSHRRAISSHS